MKQKLLKTMLLLCALVAGSSSAWAQAAAGTVMWAETWTGSTTGTSANDSYTPSANYGKGTIVYNSGSVTYTQSANSVYVRNDELAGGTKPELLLTSGKTWTISGIPTGGASELTLVYKSNNTKSSVTCTTDDTSISGSSTSYTITTGGAATITLVFSCSGNTRIDDVSLTVKTAAAAVTSLSVKTAPTKVRYEVGETLDMTGFVLNADDKDVSSGYTMTMGGAAISNGATLSSAGKKTITVAYGGKEVEQNISVGAVTSIAVTTAPTKTSYYTGDSFDPTGMVVTASLSTGEPSDPDTWTKAVTGYTYSPDGALSSSDDEVTITYATKNATQSITVTDVAVTGVSVKASTTIEKTKTETLTPTVTPSNATNKAVTWYSDDTDVATVSDAGVVTGVAAGTANITVTTNDGGYTATCVVTVVNEKGTIDAPFSVAEIRNGDAGSKTNIYVIGYIVGSWKNSKLDNDNLVNTNLALADTYDANTTAATIPVELTDGSGLRTSWGPASNTHIINVAKVILKGNSQDYFSVHAIKGASSITKVAEAVKVTTAGYATWASDSPLDFTDKDIDAYIATTKGNGTGVTFTQVNKVPANTGVLLHYAGGTTEEIPVFDPEKVDADATTGNVFVCGEGVTVATDGSTVWNYILNNKGGNIGFYKANGQTVAKNRAYISILKSESAGVKEFISLPGFDDDATGISATLNDKGQMANDIIYNVAGQRISKLQKGINIVNGKKVLF